MEIKIYIDGKLDIQYEHKKVIKKALWGAYVYCDVLCRNKRLPRTENEKKLVQSLIWAFASGQRKPF